MSSSCLIHLTLHRLHSLLPQVSNGFPDDICAYHAAEIYFARFERIVSGASCAGLFCEEFDTVFMPVTESISPISLR